MSAFGGEAWTFDDTTGQYYLHNFLAQQPDLNWWCDGVRDAFDDILRFWWDRGVAGFRIDVCNMIVKDAELRDNPPATEDDPFIQQMFGQRTLYNANQPGVHDVLRRWRAAADAGPSPVCCWARPTSRSSTSWRRTTAPGPTSCTWPSTSPSSRRPSTPRRWRRWWRAPRPSCRPGRGRCGRGRTTTCRASPRAGPRVIRGRSAWRCSCSSRCGARRCSTTATRSGSWTASCRRRTFSTRWGCATPVLHGP